MKKSYLLLITATLGASICLDLQTARAQPTGPGSALSFSGASGTYVETSLGTITNSGDFTVECWVKAVELGVKYSGSSGKFVLFVGMR